jgi:hypothetical protein
MCKKLGDSDGHAWEALHEERDRLLAVVREGLARARACVSPRVVVVQPVLGDGPEGPGW